MEDFVDAVIVGVFVFTKDSLGVTVWTADELAVLEPYDEPLMDGLTVFDALTVPVVETVVLCFREFVIVGEPDRVLLGFVDRD